MNGIIKESELILNADGSVFHLHLKPGDIGENIILVGDPDRVKLVSSCFDSIDFTIQNREFTTHTGKLNNKKVSVVSTGIGTDNIDIVINELDALVNIDLKARKVKKEFVSLNLVRIGTSGSLRKELPVGSFLLSEKVIGFDGLLNFYANRDSISDLEFEKAFTDYMCWNPQLPSPYIVSASKDLQEKFSGKEFINGVTISAPGFYGPQGRVLRLPLADSKLNDKLSLFEYKQKKITNFEMESSAIYGLSSLLGHKAIAICAIIANRYTKEYSKDYKPMVENLIKIVLNKLTG